MKCHHNATLLSDSYQPSHEKYLSQQQQHSYSKLPGVAFLTQMKSLARTLSRP